MTGKGHKLTAIAFGSFVSVLAFTGHIQTTYPVPIVLVVGAWFFGVLAGASAPDYLELARHGEKNGRLTRTSLFPHRTITHWFPLWIGLAWYVWDQNYPWFIECFAMGYIASALLHIAMDALSKSGVPVLFPTAKFRMRIPLYSTGRFTEFLAVSSIMSLFFFAAYALTK